jgi:hypothetical protein
MAMSVDGPRPLTESSLTPRTNSTKARALLRFSDYNKILITADRSSSEGTLRGPGTNGYFGNSSSYTMDLPSWKYTWANVYRHIVDGVACSAVFDAYASVIGRAIILQTAPIFNEQTPESFYIFPSTSGD